MTITKEQLTSRLQALRQQEERLLSQLNATTGAIEECGYWITQVDAPEPEQTKAD